jgi:plastocyanin
MQSFKMMMPGAVDRALLFDACLKTPVRQSDFESAAGLNGRNRAALKYFNLTDTSTLRDTALRTQDRARSGAVQKWERSMAKTYSIDIDEVDDEMGFFPAAQSIAKGDTVTWTNKMGFAHTVTADDGSFDSKLSGGGTFSHTFPAAGSFPYSCTIHPSMKGTITVT